MRSGSRQFLAVFRDLGHSPILGSAGGTHIGPVYKKRRRADQRIIATRTHGTEEALGVKCGGCRGTAICRGRRGVAGYMYRVSPLPPFGTRQTEPNAWKCNANAEVEAP